jgi:serine/threonine protein kinase
MGTDAPILTGGESIAPGYEVVDHWVRTRWLDVYVVWSHERECRCVAKVPRPDCAGNRRPRADLVNEGRLLKRLTHPHIVRAYELLDAPQPALILEALPGATLEYIIAMRDERPPIDDIAYLGLHLCSAMHYLHGCGYLHLDLKPSNVISSMGIAKVLDLSNARRPGRARRAIGTPLYMAPEQIVMEPLQPATDVWGIGAVLFHHATGLAPFWIPNGHGYQQVVRGADPVSSHRELPTALADAIDACLDRDPHGRPTVAELAAVLEGLID